MLAIPELDSTRVDPGSNGGARKRSRRLALPALVAFTSVLLVSPAPDSRKGIRLNGPLAVGFVGDVVDSRISPDATRIVFRADADTDGVVELYSAPSDGSSAPVKLNAPIVAGGIVQGFRISPDSARVVFWGDLSTNDVFELCSVPIGGGAPVKLNQLLAPLGDVATSTDVPGVEISPDSTRVVFLADANTGVPEVWELFSVPIAGGVPTRLNGELVSEGDVGIFNFVGFWRLFHPGFRIAPDGTRVLYLADQQTDGRRELYSVPIDASLAPVKLSGPMSQFGSVGYQGLDPGYGFSPDSSRVAFIANLDGSGVNELFAAPLDGSLSALRLHSALPGASSRVHPDFQFTADSSSVVFRGDLNTFFLFELFVAPLDGSAAPTELSDLSTFPGVEDGIQINGSRAVYRVGADIFSVPLDASAAPQAISGPETLDSSSEPRISADGSRVAYLAQDSSSTNVYSVPVDGSAAPIQLNAPLEDGDVTDFGLSPGDGRVVYLGDQETQGMHELYSVPLDGSAAPVKLNDVLVPMGDVQSVSPSDFIAEFEISADGSLVSYLADQEIPDVTELFAVPIDASAAPDKLNGLLGTPQVAGDLVDFQVDPTGERVVYRADQDTDQILELYTTLLPTGLSAPDTPVRLSGPDLNVLYDYAFSSDGSRVVYRTTRDDPSNTQDELQLYSVASDGSGAPVLLNASGSVSAFAIAPDSSRIVFAADEGGVQLFAVPLDGSQAPVRLSVPPVFFGLTPGGQHETVPAGHGVGQFQISPDSSRVVYLSENRLLRLGAPHPSVDFAPSVVELYSVPIDGSRNPRKLNRRLDEGENVGRFEISPDSGWVVFWQRDSSSTGKLLSVPIDRTTGPVSLGDPLLDATMGCSDGIQITADSTRVLFLAWGNGSAVELYSVPIDGSQTSVKLNAPLPPGATGVSDCVHPYPPSFQVTPGGDRVVYRADQDTAGSLQLYGAPVDGSAAGVALTPALPPGWNLTEFQLTPDGDQVVYRARNAAVFELFRASVDGSEPATRLSDPLVTNGEVADFVIAPDGRRVLYRADRDADNVFELFAVPIRGGASFRINAGLVNGGDVSASAAIPTRPSFAFVPDGKRVLYSADQAFDQRFELFLSFLPPAHRRAP